MRFFWMILGFTSLFLGAAGAILPLLPTTPFVLLSAFSFARSSPEFHHWLVNHRIFGSVIRDWHRNRAIGRPAKVAASIAVAATLALSLLFRVGTVVLAIQVLIFIPGLAFLWTRPSAEQANSADLVD